MYPFEHSDEGFSNSDQHVDERGKYKLNQTLDYDTLGYVKSLDYEIEVDGIFYYAGGVTKKEWEQRRAENPKDGYRWRWSKELFNFGLANDFVVIKTAGMELGFIPRPMKEQPSMMGLVEATRS